MLAFSSRHRFAKAKAHRAASITISPVIVCFHFVPKSCWPNNYLNVCNATVCLQRHFKHLMPASTRNAASVFHDRFLRSGNPLKGSRSPFRVKVDGDLVNGKVIANDIHHFHAHQPFQWSLMSGRSSIETAPNRAEMFDHGIKVITQNNLYQFAV